ncbi:hypothetical protein D6783_01835 [Candidatus Woesearchaeota archaeon]|nr:MAG: hypothetical protein D6783_01835 [Candidatus Woesearchaeota archaeon]
MAKQRLEQELVGLFAQDLVKAYSIHQISKNLNKAYPHINKTIHSLREQGVVRWAVVGRAHLCSINLQNPLSRNLLARNAIERLQTLPSKKKTEAALLREELNKLHTPTPILTALLHKDRIIVILPRLEDAASTPSKILGKTLQFHTKTSWQQTLIKQYAEYKHPLLLAGYENYYTFLSEIIPVLAQRHATITWQ